MKRFAPVVLAVLAAGVIVWGQAAPPAKAAIGGLTTGAQTIYGAKTFTADLTVNGDAGITGSAAAGTFSPTSSVAPAAGLYLGQAGAPSISSSGVQVAQFNAGAGIAAQLNANYGFYCAGGTSCGMQFAGPAQLKTELADGASSIAFKANTTTTWSTSGAVLAEFQNNGTKKADIDINGNVILAASATASKGIKALSGGTGTVTVLTGAICTCADTTSTAACRTSVSGTTLTLTGTGTDSIAYLCL